MARQVSLKMIKRFLRSLHDFGRHWHQAAPVGIGIDQNVPAQNGTGPVATGTDRYKIARDEFY